MTSINNPNAARPTLTLLGKKPLALAAFKAKLKLQPEPETPAAIVNDQCGASLSMGRDGREDQGLAHPASACGHGLQATDDTATLKPEATAKTPPPTKSPKKPPAPAAPFVHIEGDPVYPPEGHGLHGTYGRRTLEG